MIQAKMLFVDSLPTGGSKIPVGIHEKVMFMGLAQDQSFVDVLFQNAEGRVINKRLFNPDGSKPKEGESVADAISRQQNNNLRHVIHMLRVVYGDEAAGAVQAADYDAFMKKAVALLNPKKGALVNLKVTLDRSGKYSDLGFWPNNYVERYEEGTPVSLKFTKDEQKAIEDADHKGSAQSDVDLSPAPAKAATDDLPF